MYKKWILQCTNDKTNDETNDETNDKVEEIKVEKVSKKKKSSKKIQKRGVLRSFSVSEPPVWWSGAKRNVPKQNVVV